MTAELQPAVVLMDINMPGINGIEATSRIVESGQETAVLMLTMFDDDTVFSAMRAGGVIFSSGIAERMLNYFAAGAPSTAAARFPDLTPREREILELIASGYTNSAVAEKLVLSPKTVRNQVSNIFSKLQVAGRAEAIIKARDAGLGQD